MEEDDRRMAEARARNLEYIRQLDEQEARRAADEFLRAHGGLSDASAVGSESAHRMSTPSSATSTGRKNTSVYVSGLTTYMACKQLEGVCAKLGKVRRIKFYQDERGGLKGDALVTFASYNMMCKAVERLNHLEIKPGVLLTATEAHFERATESSSNVPDPHSSDAATATADVAVALPPRLFDPEVVIQSSAVVPTAHGNEGTATASGLDEQQTDATTLPSSELSLPSRSVILSRVWDPLAAQDDATQFFTELEDDMRQECGKHGRVEHVHILPTGAVMIRYEALASAIKCLQAMHGRWFDGRQLEAEFDPSTPEEPEDDATKLDAFFASLG